MRSMYQELAISTIPIVLVAFLFSCLFTLNVSHSFQPENSPSLLNQTGIPSKNLSNLTTQSTVPSQELKEQIQQKIVPAQELQNAKDFSARGDIDSVIYTVNGKWIANGTWLLTVSDNKLTSFETRMVWDNGTATHSHEFQNFELGDKNKDIKFDSDGHLKIVGKMDVGTNNIIIWPNVPADITLEKGKIITIKVDHQQTDRHFGGQAIHGVLSSFLPCNNKPGPNMIVPTGACT